jgi:hypothetical protein
MLGFYFTAEFFRHCLTNWLNIAGKWPSYRMRAVRFVIFVLVLFTTVTFAAQKQTPQKQKLRERCLSAIEQSEVPVKRNALKESLINVTDGHYLFQFNHSDGGVFFCDICDESEGHCETMGLELSYRPANGENKRLPAELDRKCIYFLQKELSGGHPEVNHDLVERIGDATPHHTETRWVYEMKLDDNEYRCVIRKTDNNFRVEQKEGDEWRALAAGTLF